MDDVRKTGYLVAILIIFIGLFYYNTYVLVGKLDNATLAIGVDAFGLPIRTVENFETKDPTMFVSVLAHDMPNETLIRFVWKQGADILSNSQTLVTGSQYVSSQFKTKNKVPPGDYILEIYMKKNTKPEVVLAFKIKS